MEQQFDHIFNSMSIDEYYDFCFGKLPYRSIKFHSTEAPFNMPTPVINFTDAEKYTRITNWGLFPNHGVASICTLEEPCDYKENNDERYYPINDIHGTNRKLYKKYTKIKNNKVTFIGRCGLYVYIDMDMAISISLKIAENL